MALRSRWKKPESCGSDDSIDERNDAGEIMNGTEPTPRTDILPTVDDFEIAAAGAALAAITAAISERHRCLLALSGGDTPRDVYRRLGDLLVARGVDLSRVYLIFVDERMVPADDADSNYGMVQRELISRVPIPPSQVYRIRGEAKADAAARSYERELQTIFPLFAGRCDLILLGVGEDGHTASLFPGTEVLREMQHAARAVFVPRLQSWRVTLTLPVINRAQSVIFLASGRRKAAIVGKIFSGTERNEDLPATLVHPHPGTLTWLLDAEAASQLPSVQPIKPDTAF
jgi:6-phosphogluconolactonase